MRSNFHESFAGSKTKPPSERSTGLVFAAVALIAALLWRKQPQILWVALGVAGVLALVSLIAPALLKPLNFLWFKFGLLLHRVVNPIVMFILFVFVFVPAGALMRIWHDPLRSRPEPDVATYWIDREEGQDAQGSMTNQF